MCIFNVTLDCIILRKKLFSITTLTIMIDAIQHFAMNENKYKQQRQKDLSRTFYNLMVYGSKSPVLSVICELGFISCYEAEVSLFSRVCVLILHAHTHTQCRYAHLRFKISPMGVSSINSLRNANKALLFKRREGEGGHGCMREACDDSFGVYV